MMRYITEHAFCSYTYQNDSNSELELNMSDTILQGQHGYNHRMSRLQVIILHEVKD